MVNKNSLERDGLRQLNFAQDTSWITDPVTGWGQSWEKAPQNRSSTSESCMKSTSTSAESVHVFIDFKNEFDRVWHTALWATMWKYNINAKLFGSIDHLYDKSIGAVQMNGSTGEWFRTTVGVGQGYLVSPILCNICLERIKSDALEEHDGKNSTGVRSITNLRFADDIDALAKEEQEKAVVESFDKTA